jgi:hypothetical protein
MAVERRLQEYPGMRIDVPQIRSIESSVSADFDSTLRGLITGLNRPLLMRGFNINIPSSNIPASTLTIQVSDSAILHSSAAESGTILTVPYGTPDDVLSPSSPNVIGAFQNGTVNYVGLQYIRTIDPATADQTAGWSQSQKLEFQRTVPVGYILEYQYVISTTGFSTNLPLYIVGVSPSGTVTYITKAVPGLFRLGSGGTVPNPQYQYDFDDLLNPQTGTIREWINTSSVVTNPMSVVPGNPVNAFTYGDWSIGCMKDWMDAVMTRLAQLAGSAYWYIGSQTNNNTNLFDIFFDSAGSVMTGAGFLTYNYILQATHLSSGAWTTTFTNPNILSGDSYVIGVTSGRSGVLENFIGNSLVINSLTGTGFVVGETLLNRATSQMNYSIFQLTNYADTVAPPAPLTEQSWAWLTRIPGSSAPTTAVTSWSYDTQSTFQQIVTINTSTPHGLQPGSLVNVIALTGDVNAPNGIQWVRTVPTATSFTIKSTQLLTTVTPTIGAATVALASNLYDAYYPTIPFTSWTYVGTAITLNGFAQPVPYQPPTTQSCTTTLADQEIVVTNSATIQAGQLVTGASMNPNTVVWSIVDATHIVISKAPLSAGSNVLTFSDQIVVSGTTAATNPPNGTWAVTGITPQGGVQFTASSAPTGTAAVTTPLVWPDYYQFLLTVTDAVPTIYNVVDVNAVANGPASFLYSIGPSTIPPQPAATGGIGFDGVVGVATVADPVMISEIQYASGDLLVTTYDLNGLVSSVGYTAAVTIYGNPTVTGYAQTYQNIEITVNGTSPNGNTVSGNTFAVSANPSSSVYPLPNLGTYTNGGADQIFLNFPGNPYPGPVSWSSDINIKGIIGDLEYTIPQTATATGDPLANMFNVGGVTGTAFLQDKQVMYVVLERNQSVSSGATFNCTSPAAIVGASFLDIHGNPLVADPVYGDFVKFANEDEGKWVRIASYSGPSQVNLISDNGLPPTAVQRPNNVGQLIYCKATYPQVIVEPHYLVPPSTDVMWLAVRRDNGSSLSKMYFRALELQIGETRLINDSTPNGLLLYTGANNESASIPNYSTSAPDGPWQLTQPLTVSAVYDSTNVVTFTAPPTLGFQNGDTFTITIGSTVYGFTIIYVLSGVSVQVSQSVSPLSNGNIVTYYQNDFAILDSDNLTIGIRKEDRELAHVNTTLDKTVYDESAFVQQFNFTGPVGGTGVVAAGQYIFTGAINNPSGLAWVLQGTAPVTITVDNTMVTMPGGNPSVGSYACLVHIISGAASFTDGTPINQINTTTGASVSTGFTLTNPGNPPFTAPTIATGVQLVLPPNRRTQVYSGGGGYAVYPADSYYKASSVDALAGEDLMVIANDTIRQSQIDYLEIFSGPRAIIQIVRPLPVETRLRFRSLATYGSALIAASNGVTLQIAYNNGQVINTLAGVPVTINAADAASGGAAIALAGSLRVNGNDGIGNIVGGIIGNLDQNFNVGFETNKPYQVWAAELIAKSQTSYTGSGAVRTTAAATTTNSGATNVADSAITVPNNMAISVRASGVAREISNNGQAAFTCEGSFYMSGGTLTMMGSPVTKIIGFSGNGSSYAMTMTVVGNQVVLVAYGDVTATYWAFTIDYQMIGTSS